MDVVLLPPDNDGKQINNVPKLGYRSMSFSRANDDQYMLTYLLKTNEGVYSPIDRSRVRTALSLNISVDRLHNSGLSGRTWNIRKRPSGKR